MPICPKCGKSFSSDQALCYHLNKKYKCGTWKCEKCQIVFDTKHKLKIHMMSCEQSKQYDDVPSIDIMTKIYSNEKLLFYEIDESGTIFKASPAIEKFGFQNNDLIGKKIDNYLVQVDDDQYHKNDKGDMIQVDKTLITNKLLLLKCI